jgi:hypothetical protein
VFENIVNGANDSGAQVAPPSVEYEKPQPSLYSQSFQAPASNVPLGSIPSDSSLFAKKSFVMSAGPTTLVGVFPAAAKPVSPTRAATQKAITPITHTVFSIRTAPPFLGQKPGDSTRLPLRPADLIGGEPIRCGASHASSARDT